MSDAEAGDIQVSILPDGWHVGRADPWVLISEEVFNALSDGESHGASGARLNDGTLRIDALNCSVTYRVNETLANGSHTAELLERIDHDTPVDGAE